MTLFNKTHLQLFITFLVTYVTLSLLSLLFAVIIFELTLPMSLYQQLRMMIEQEKILGSMSLDILGRVFPIILSSIVLVILPSRFKKLSKLFTILFGISSLLSVIVYLGTFFYFRESCSVTYECFIHYLQLSILLPGLIYIFSLSTVFRSWKLVASSRINKETQKRLVLQTVIYFIAVVILLLTPVVTKQILRNHHINQIITSGQIPYQIYQPTYFPKKLRYSESSLSYDDEGRVDYFRTIYYVSSCSMSISQRLMFEIEHEYFTNFEAQVSSQSGTIMRETRYINNNQATLLYKTKEEKPDLYGVSMLIGDTVVLLSKLCLGNESFSGQEIIKMAESLVPVE